MCSMITLRTVLGPPCISCPFVIGVAGADTGVVQFCAGVPVVPPTPPPPVVVVVVVVSACAACKAACADAFYIKLKTIN